MESGRKDRNTPLDEVTWVRALVRLRASLDGDEASKLDRHLRRSFHLATLAPDPFWQAFAPAIHEDEFERLLGDDLSRAISALLTAQLEFVMICIKSFDICEGAFLPRRATA